MEQNPAVERDFFMVFAKSRLALNIVFMQYISYDYASLIVPTGYGVFAHGHVLTQFAIGYINCVFV